MNILRYIKALTLATALGTMVVGCNTDFDRPPMMLPDDAGFGTMDEPYSVEQVLNMNNPGTLSWVRGYIVGWVDGMSLASGATFEVPATSASNIILAPEPYTYNYEECIVVQLPSGVVRTGLNLQNNPANLNKEVKVRGSLEKYFGVPGVKSTVAYVLDGKTVGDISDPEETPDPESATPAGSGTASDPYNVAKARDLLSTMAADEESEPVYIAGVVKGAPKFSFSYGSAQYDLVDEGYTLTLLVYNGYYYEGGKFTDESQLKDGDKVVIYGKLVNYKGNTPEVTTGSAIVSINGATSGGSSEPDPDPTGTIFSETFASGQGAFTIENVNLPEGLTYIWSAYSSAKCMKASGYVSKAYDTDAYLISPEIDLTAATKATLTFDQATNYFTDAAQARKEVTVVARESGATAWTALEVPTYPSSQSWDFVSSGDIDLKAFVGKKIQIAFRYTSTAAKAGTWEIKNVVIQ